MRLLSSLFAFTVFSGIKAVDPLVSLKYAQYEGTSLPNAVSQWLGIRYAAPPLGELRFSAPTPPPANNTPKKQTSMEIYVCRTKMVQDSMPIMVFIQGRGWSSNSNGNFNGSLLVENSQSNMMVITLNYRLGLLGLLAGNEVIEGGSLNNGLKDVIFALRWIQDQAALFGGDKDHVVLSGCSVGALIITYLMVAHNGTGLPGLFHAAAAESSSFSGDAQPVDLQSGYDALVTVTGCNTTESTLSCLRSLNVTELQTKSPQNSWSPIIDNDLLVAPTYQMYEQKRFRQVPIIYGITTNEGTKNVDKSVTSATFDSKVRNSFGNITELQLNELKATYPESLNNITFSDATLNATYEGAGNEWQRLAAMMGEVTTCISLFQSDMHDAAGNTANWQYHYDVLDPHDASNGYRVWYVVKLNAIWGPNNTDGGPPPSYRIANSDGGNSGAIPIMQGYWISFVRTFNPNTLRAPGTAEWTPYSTRNGQRVLIHSNRTEMETLTNAERDRCKLMIQYAKARNAYAQPLTTLQPFANGTFVDPYAIANYTAIDSN